MVGDAVKLALLTKVRTWGVHLGGNGPRLFMDGAALGTEKGTALFLPGQCLSAAQGQEKDAKSLFPAGEVLQQGGPYPTPTASHRPDSVWLPLGRLKGDHVPSPPWQCIPVRSQVR